MTTAHPAPPEPRPTSAGPTLRLRRDTRSGDGPGTPSVSAMLEVLEDVERVRASRYAVPAQADAFVTGRFHLRGLAADLLGVDPHRLGTDFSCPRCGTRGGAADHGRPGFSLDGVRLPLALSLSRSPGFVLLGALELRRSAPTDADTVPGGSHVAVGLGVDLEAIEAVRFAGFDDVALSPTERTRILALPERERNAARARLWARKEAIVKAAGVGFGPSGPALVDVGDRAGIVDLVECDGVDLGPLGLVAAVAVL